ncbi:MAG TPA: bifunctional methylenetetrahydrofolate dehydrogenase/methenyltetrahydrofolate cyclohydrolase FolD [Rhabdochlamydiaceae bacterium]|nr:bifunctional methylenetetrahydrofolate dehydrogenase/methenyltetrahydrofolate cyclohydrolase FolD [Rhabdochlamydiaceae bacterium]
MIIDGTAIAKVIQDRVAEAIRHITSRAPGLAFILVGDNPASSTYINMKKKKCKEVGILSVDMELPETISESQLLEEIVKLNQDPSIDGILVQLPLPKHISTTKVMEAISPKKDVDGFHPLNVGKMLLGETDGFLPCTPLGITVLLTHSNIEVAGKHVVVLGRSNIVGKPLAAILMQKAPHCNATVTIANSYTQNLVGISKSADILVAAIGHPHFVKKEMVKKGAVVIDVGINRIEEHAKIVGDVDFDAVAPLCSHITPVPGGVGPMTIAMLLSNTLLSFQRKSQ